MASAASIWYQGESNAGKAYQYRDLFPLMIKSWRDEWGQGDFSFYWVQLADFLPETSEPPKQSAWAELREAQTMTMSRLPKTGEAVIIDLGEAQDIHPRNKQDVANAAGPVGTGAMITALKIPFHSPILSSRWKSRETRSCSSSSTCGGGLKAADVPRGSGVCHRRCDHKFVNAEAKIVGPAADRGLVGPGVRAGRCAVRVGGQPGLQRV